MSDHPLLPVLYERLLRRDLKDEAAVIQAVLIEDYTQLPLGQLLAVKSLKKFCDNFYAKALRRVAIELRQMGRTVVQTIGHDYWVVYQFGAVVGDGEVDARTLTDLARGIGDLEQILDAASIAAASEVAIDHMVLQFWATALAVCENLPMPPWRQLHDSSVDDPPEPDREPAVGPGAG